MSGAATHKPAPWIIHRAGKEWARAKTRQAAMNRVDRPWVPGFITIRHGGTGEAWERRGVSWIKTEEGKRRRRAQ